MYRYNTLLIHTYSLYLDVSTYTRETKQKELYFNGIIRRHDTTRHDTDGKGSKNERDIASPRVCVEGDDFHPGTKHLFVKEEKRRFYFHSKAYCYIIYLYFIYKFDPIAFDKAGKH